jgi:hypothetical protein
MRDRCRHVAVARLFRGGDFLQRLQDSYMARELKVDWFAERQNNPASEEAGYSNINEILLAAAAALRAKSPCRV